MFDLTVPLNDLLKKCAKWIWSKEYEDPFQKVICYLSTDFSLAQFDPKKEIIVAFDSSNYGIGAAILNKYKDDTIKSIAHTSRTRLKKKAWL